MEKIKNIFSNLKSSLNENSDKRRAFMPKILSLLVSFCIWFYVVSVESPVVEKTITDIPVEIELSDESELEPFSGENETVDITVKGKRSDLRTLDADDFEAVLDVSDFTDAGEYNVRIDIKTPSTATVVEQSVTEVKVFLDSYYSNSVDVEIKQKNAPREAGVELICVSDPSEVIVSGPRSVVSEISKAQVVFDCNGAVETEMHDNLDVTLYSGDNSVIESPYLKYDSNIYVSITPYLTKYIDLKLDINDLVEGEYDYILKNNTTGAEIKQIEVCGPLEILKDLNEYTIDLSYKKDYVVDINLPENIEVTASQPTEVQVKVDLNYQEMTLEDVPIRVEAPDTITYELSEFAKDVAVRYIPSHIDDLSSENAELVLQLEEESISGSYPLILKINGAQITDQFLEYDSISTDVKIIK